MCVCTFVRQKEKEREKRKEKENIVIIIIFLVWGAAGFLPVGRFLDAPNCVSVTVSFSVCLCDLYFYSNA